jgi:S1-C subfamily serine protease
LSEIRGGVLQSADILEKRGRRALADDLRQQLSAASTLASTPLATAPAEKSERERRSGTAFAVRPDGLLLTANHIVEGADKIEVKCPGQPAVLAQVEGSSPTVDLAVLKVDLPALRSCHS